MTDGIHGPETAAVQDLLYIAVSDRAVASSIVTLGWVQDGVDGVEAAAIEWMGNVASAEVAASVVSLGWVRDGVEEIEVKAIEHLSYVAYDSSEVALSLLSMGWVQDGIDGVEAGAIEWVANMSTAEVASSVATLGWVQDGVEEIEVKAIEELSYVAYDSSAVALSLLSLDWVQDGTDGLEVGAIEWMANMASVEVAASVVSLGWMQDSVEETEVKAIEELSYLTVANPREALRIVGMQFVETLDPPDLPALTSLRLLAAFRPEAFARVMSHEALSGGITDGRAPVVATLNGVARTNSGLIDVLLNPSNVLLEWRTIALPLSGDVELFIIRTRPGAARSMDLLEHSVRTAEALMEAPLPTNYVGLLYAESVAGSFAGTNFGTHIAIRPRFDVDDGSREASFASHNIAHEVAHYYWRDNADWVDEGAADFAASFIDASRTGGSIGVTSRPCAYAGSIAELEALDLSRHDAEFTCNYSLGERLFVDLYRTLGAERFVQGFRDLYRDESIGIEHIREAFRLTGDDGAESAVIARWYDEGEHHGLPDTGPVDPVLPSIGGQVKYAYVAIGQYGSPVSTLSQQNATDWVYLVLELSYKVSADHSLPLEIVEYYQDGFEFRRRSTALTLEKRYIGWTQWLSIGFAPSETWAPGRYRVEVYTGERKIVEVEYEVTS